MKDAATLENPFDGIPGFECFACGANHPSGLRLKLQKGDDHVFCRFTARKEFSGFSDILHGGIQATLLDEVMWWAAFDSRSRLCLTQTMELELKLPVHIGAELVAMGRVINERDSSADVVGELRIGEQIVARANGCYVFPPARIVARALGVEPDKIPAKLKPYVGKL
jgi:acyl-coenzyme A thioesterase PaaI-like protein